MVRVFAIPQKIDQDVYFSYLETTNTLFDRHNPKHALQNAFLVRAFRDSTWTLHEYRRDSDVTLLSYHRNLTRRRRGDSWDTTWSKYSTSVRSCVEIISSVWFYINFHCLICDLITIFCNGVFRWGPSSWRMSQIKLLSLFENRNMHYCRVRVITTPRGLFCKYGLHVSQKEIFKQVWILVWIFVCGPFQRSQEESQAITYVSQMRFVYLILAVAFKRHFNWFQGPIQKLSLIHIWRCRRRG